MIVNTLVVIYLSSCGSIQNSQLMQLAPRYCIETNQFEYSILRKMRICVLKIVNAKCSKIIDTTHQSLAGTSVSSAHISTRDVCIHAIFPTSTVASGVPPHAPQFLSSTNSPRLTDQRSILRDGSRRLRQNSRGPRRRRSKSDIICQIITVFHQL